MKFAIVSLFTLALALGVQSSVIPWGGVVTELSGGGLSYTAVSSPVAWPWGVHGAGTVIVGPAPVAPVVAPVVVAAAGPGSYVAKTRGAVHTAPLPGHLNSVANINVAPAPGTL